ncbi:TetR/AcrR family transcriptional regulator [Nocardia asteroides NBRC 15531]|uniref:TetR family transcriptional regulator n=1 Tax=Nocardia asteroides NBRC 15531 TaxID=1110697 RepID=U5E3C4_NOCAS|nr:TetR/AcrR family transcriptional regulator [Nocardia asteroides]TLF66679.1 TetR/AcrR family transcriptional regulator [Nocardia asteroides NBRC 15531]UGT46214.1 TetR/AcrR family transcriptional regulator [Nocardia asteroides]SFM98242.1 transcriptional regulator, TetR family [Nocardia asteroides]VEG34988.1 Solvent efflux pump srpABC operon corepressor [Nocardia asteroides]GAD82287.1 putative TetR family transcriptional regulator [Nocardia asteroides NBRC 15531]
MARAAYAARMAPEQRREQLLDAVLQVIVEQGVHKVSIDTVARTAGVSRPVVYGQFDDSEQLLRASLDREEAAALQEVADAVPDAAAADPVEAVLAALESFLDAVHSAPRRWQAVFALVDSSTPAFRRRLDRGRRALIVALEQFVDSAVSAERRAEIDVELCARALYSLFWDSGRLILAEPETFPRQRVLTFARTVVQALPVFARK